jgi:hypothetical protein
MQKLLRLTLVALLLGATVVTAPSMAQVEEPPPTCDPANPDCKPNPPLAS